MLRKYYHATPYENLESIVYHKGILKGCDGMVYLTDSPESAATFVAIRGCKDILVIEVLLDDSKVEESFDHSPAFFKCRAWMHKGTIIPEYIQRLIRYNLTKIGREFSIYHEL